MKHAADFDSTISMGIRAPARGHQFPVMPSTLGAHWGVVMLIAQDIADLSGQLAEQQWCDLTVRDIRDGELSRQGKAEAADRYGQVQLPAVPLPMPSRLAPMGFGINGGVWDDARFSIFLMPHAAVRAQRRAITGCPVPLLRPGIEDGHQVAPEPPNETRQRWGNAAKRRSQVRRVGNWPCSASSERS